MYSDSKRIVEKAVTSFLTTFLMLVFPQICHFSSFISLKVLSEQAQASGISHKLKGFQIYNSVLITLSPELQTTSAIYIYQHNPQVD